MGITLAWMDDTGAHSAPVNADYLRVDPSGYIDALRTGEMWDISVRDANGCNITSQYL